MKTLNFFVTFLFLTTNAVVSQTRTSNFDSLFNYLQLNEDFNGNVLFAEDGKAIYKKSFGYSDFGTNALLDENSVFELASLSKQFTAMGILILMEKGKLSLDDSLKAYFPELPYRGVTIRHLLTHTSGLPDHMPWFLENWDKSKVAKNQDVIDMLARLKPGSHFTPGEKFEYSNTGYVLLASIIEKVTGKSYAEVLKRYIFRPLSMSRTSVRRVSPISFGKSNYTKGYIIDKASKNPILKSSLKENSYLIYLSGIVGDGSVNSTTSDLLKWDRALYNDKLAQASTLNEAFSPSKTKNGTAAYGYGWGLRTGDESTGKFVYHEGDWNGYDNFISRFIERNKTVIVLRNVSNNNRVSGIYEAYTNILFNIPFDLPKIEQR